MAKVRRAPLAAADIEEIWFQIALDSEAAAERVIGQIYDAEQRLAEFPELGRVRDELSAGLRSWPLGSYVIFYRPEGAVLNIVRILHGARDFAGLFDPS